jgi:hypothetical protein
MEDSSLLPIKGPNPELDGFDRIQQCELGLEPHFLELAARAKAAGWSSSEVAMVLAALADNNILAEAATDPAARSVRRAISKLSKR